MARAEVDLQLRVHAGDEPGKVVAWMRTCVLSDDAAEDLLAQLDRSREIREQAARRFRRRRLSTKGEIA